MRYWMVPLLVAVSVPRTIAQIGVASEQDLRATVEKYLAAFSARHRNDGQTGNGRFCFRSGRFRWHEGAADGVVRSSPSPIACHSRRITPSNVVIAPRCGVRHRSRR